MSDLNEKIQEAYISTVVYQTEDDLVNEYMNLLDRIENFENSLDEKWPGKVDIKQTGEHAGKTVAQIKKEIKKLKGKGQKEQMGELVFALRSKTGWKKGKGAAGLGESEDLTEQKLTRQHFIQLAGIMKKSKTVPELKDNLLTWLKGTNPMFDEVRFKKAAGM